MQNFQYYTPTKVVFGKDSELQTGSLLLDQGAKKVLVHYGGGSVVRSGLLSRIENCLKECGIEYVTLGGVVPNPRLSKVREGIALAQKEGVDFLLAVGGGSVIDSAKAIAYGIANDGDVWDFYEGKRQPVSCAPVGVVLTLSATGSEMSNSSVITNEDGWLKRPLDNDLGRPRFAVMNPAFTLTLPEYQTMCGCADIMMHTMERYFSHEKDTKLVDSLAEALLRSVMENARILLKDPADLDARAEIMWAGSLSHNGLTGCGRAGDWACHLIEHELGGMFDVAHGAGLTAVWGGWARYVFKEDVSRFVQFAVNVMGVENDPSDPEKTALAGIEALEAFFQEIHLPIRVSQMHIQLTEEQISELATKCAWFGQRTVGVFKELNAADLEQIYRIAR